MVHSLIRSFARALTHLDHNGDNAAAVVIS